MLVSELIDRLQVCPHDMTVLGRGYESGYDDLEIVHLNTLVKCNNAWYDGSYQDVDDYNKDQRIDIPKDYICLQ